MRSPAALKQYLAHLLRGQAPRYVGHNPAGGWMIVALLVCLILLGLTGRLYLTDAFWGEGWLANVHADLGYALCFLVVLHVLGGAVSAWCHQENLIGAMITGYKRKPLAGDQSPSD